MVYKTVGLKTKGDAELFTEFLAEYLDENVTSLSKELFTILDDMRRELTPQEQKTEVVAPEVSLQ